MNILVINCGSSSLKFQLIDAETEKQIAKGLCERIGIDGSQIVYQPAGGEKEETVTPMPDHTKAIELVLSALMNEKTGVVKSLDEIGAVGHRIVHGGEKFASSTIITGEVIEAIRACNDLAPLHNPANLIGIDACKKLMPDTPMVGVFDTAFHQTMPQYAYLYGLPYEYYEKYKVRRYGFHGTSHAYVSRRAAEILGKNYEDMKIIVCHLGNGASISAVENKSIDQVMTILNKKSGVLGLSDNLSSDFRDLEKSYMAGEERGLRTILAFSYRVAKYIGAYTAAMNGVDAICFTAGVGENNPVVRKHVSGIWALRWIRRKIRCAGRMHRSVPRIPR